MLYGEAAMALCNTGPLGQKGSGNKFAFLQSPPPHPPLPLFLQVLSKTDDLPLEAIDRYNLSMVERKAEGGETAGRWKNWFSAKSVESKGYWDVPFHVLSACYPSVESFIFPVEKAMRMKGESLSKLNSNLKTKINPNIIIYKSDEIEYILSLKNEPNTSTKQIVFAYY